MNTGIIGYGSMGKMLLEKFSDNGIAPENLYVFNRTESKLASVGEKACICQSQRDLAACCDILFLCVPPSSIKAVLEDIRTEVKEGCLLVSLNGSVTFEQMGRVIKHKTAKAIPSVTAEIDKSQTLVCYNELAEERDKKALEELLGCIGNVIELPEHEIGMGSELVSCMPGFIASVFDVICQAAGKHTEIPYEQVIRMVLNTMCATGELMLEKQMSFEEVVARVATKGGITEEGARVIYEQFPETADELFEKTLAKRKLTAERAEEYFR
ncbi:MAG: NAD(P)-binding domain-containing protein [Clostridia bacterium]|nr:NAD(P)-binding domain-containing protein [Clostridia bacterium]